LGTSFGFGNVLWLSGEHFSCGNALGFWIDASAGPEAGELWGSATEGARDLKGRKGARKRWTPGGYG